MERRNTVSVRTFIAIVVGLAIGLWLADVDRTFPFLRHRSIVTHGIVLVGLLYLLLRNNEERWVRSGIASLALGMAVHLSFDLFPRAWQGLALITVPLVGVTGATFSMLWLATNLLACVYFALWLLEKRTEAVVAFGGMVVGFSIAATRETSVIPALIVLMAAIVVATFLPNHIISGQTVAQRVLHRQP
jgi:hypothetical protein